MSTRGATHRPSPLPRSGLSETEKSIVAVVTTLAKDGKVTANRVAKVVKCRNDAARKALFRLASFGVIPSTAFTPYKSHQLNPPPHRADETEDFAVNLERMKIEIRNQRLSKTHHRRMDAC